MLLFSNLIGMKKLGNSSGAWRWWRFRSGEVSNKKTIDAQQIELVRPPPLTPSTCGQ
jgi:hypothetical protein